MRRHQSMSSCNTGTTRDDGDGSQANQSECSAVGFAPLHVVDSKDEDLTVVWAMARHDSAEYAWPLLMMSAPTPEAKTREAEADLVRVTVAARTQEAVRIGTH